MFLFTPALSLHAAILNVDCSKKSLANEIDARLDKTAINTVNFSGDCVGNVLLSGHANLTLAGAAGASITGVGADESAVKVEGGFVTMQNLTVNATAVSRGVECTNRSVCILRNVEVQAGSVAGANAVLAQDQSAIDIIGDRPHLRTEREQRGRNWRVRRVQHQYPADVGGGL